MDHIKKIINNKFLLTAFSIGALILLLVLVLSPNRKSSTQVFPSSPPNDMSAFTEFGNLTEEKLNNAISYRTLIADRLPIYLPNYPTSANIEVNISISIHPTEPSITRLDITGLSYLNKAETDPKKNPNIQAFKEGYLKSLQLMREAGIEPKQLLFSYGEADYVRSTANEWVAKLGLLR